MLGAVKTRNCELFTIHYSLFTIHKKSIHNSQET